jgi:hypothetical protein
MVPMRPLGEASAGLSELWCDHIAGLVAAREALTGDRTLLELQHVEGRPARLSGAMHVPDAPLLGTPIVLGAGDNSSRIN